MKLNITIEQFNELSDKGKLRLKKWWKPIEGDMVCTINSREEGRSYKILTGYLQQMDDGKFIICIKRPIDNNFNKKQNVACAFLHGIIWLNEKDLPLLSIGQMIEFLADHSDRRYKIRRLEFFQTKDEYDEWWWIKPDSLCDDLWLEVKKILNETK